MPESRNVKTCYILFALCSNRQNRRPGPPPLIETLRVGPCLKCPQMVSGKKGKRAQLHNLRKKTGSHFMVFKKRKLSLRGPKEKGTTSWSWKKNRKVSLRGPEKKEMMTSWSLRKGHNFVILEKKWEMITSWSLKKGNDHFVVPKKTAQLRGRRKKREILTSHKFSLLTLTSHFSLLTKNEMMTSWSQRKLHNFMV